MSSENPKINPYSLSDLKNTTDDALPNYLTSINFSQSHYFTDVRLALGYTAVAIAGAAFYFDYTLGWEKTKTATLGAVLVYFALNSALTYWIWGVEKGRVFVGEFNGAKVTMQSSVDKHIPIYHLRVKYLLPGKSEAHALSLQAPFTTWFTEDGYFAAKPFQQWLATEVPVVGNADPKSVTKGSTVVREVKPVEAGVVMADIAADSPGVRRTGKGRK